MNPTSTASDSGAPLGEVAVLPGNCTLRTADDLKAHLLPLAAAEGVVRVDASRVEQVDSAGFQLLVALGRALAHHGGALSIHSPSAAFRSAARVLGLEFLLEPVRAE
ncbi:MAG: STAS domain-containing protein [Proteobacteria bacterium]|nr:STAS domain-containing protein [Pseudomonadota bacterium]